MIEDVFIAANYTTRVLTQGPPLAEIEDAAEVLEWVSKGRQPFQVYATGVGKSGIAARKFVDSLAAHGVPAQFLDPVEALHGGLGRLHEDDRVVAVSASGETKELLVLATELEERRTGVAYDVGVYGPRVSQLGAHTRTVIPTHFTPRDDGATRYVPSSSFIAACVIGDALALRVADFNCAAGLEETHPGGNLGATRPWDGGVLSSQDDERLLTDPPSSPRD